MVLNHRDLKLEGVKVVASALESFRNRPALGFSDCLMLEAARKAGARKAGARRSARSNRIFAEL
jgi:predicted nucleic-acid-binding protein